MIFKVISTVIVLLNFISFLWSVIGVFSKHSARDDKSYLLLQLNSVALWVFWRHTKIASGYRFSLVFSKDIPNQLIVVGLYKYVRHPFYMIYLITYFSVALVTRSPLVIVLSITMFVIYRKAALMEESKFLDSPLGGEYADYIKRTGRFFPRLFVMKRKDTALS